MNRVLVEKTPNYLIVKIPLRAVETGRAELSPRARKTVDSAIAEGLRDIAAGRVVGPFRGARALRAALRSLGK